jgi:DNA-binding transcriptional LysR family regulator
MLDWDDLRFVLAVARGGSLSAAARALAVTQPTVGRRIDAFEQAVGARLFQRQPSGYALTAAGRAMLAHVERMEHEALGAERLVTGRDAGVRGSVRITASEWLVVRILGPALAGLVERHRGLTLDVVADTRHLNLARREADLALRPRRFEHAAIYQRRCTRIELGLYASPAYLSRHGVPDAANACAGHTLIAMHDDIGDIARGWLAAVAAGARTAVRTNGREAMATMAAAGIGLACLPRIVGDAHPGLRRIATSRPPPDRVLWLGVHRDARAIPRVRAVIDFLVDELARLEPAFAPGR